MSPISPEITFIIPSYNTGNYLSEACRSLLQDIKDCRIIIVDDASSDNSHIEIEKLLNKHPQISTKLLPSNTPGGAGAPSNIGIDLVETPFLAFLDSDDFIVSSYFSDLLRLIKRTDSDIVIGSYKNLDTISHLETPAYDTDRWTQIALNEESKEISKDQLLLLSPEPWRKVYKTSLFSDRAIRFPENKWFNEDYPFHWLTALSSKKITLCNNDNYKHRISRAGQTTQKLDERIFFLFDHTEIILNHMDKNGFGEFKGNLLLWLIIGHWKLKQLNVKKQQYYDALHSLIQSFDRNAILKFKTIASPNQIKIYETITKNHSVEKALRELP